MPYKCATLNVDVQSDNLEVSKITGYHHYRRNNNYVEKLEYNHHKWSTYLPNGFGIIFPNLLEFEVRETPLKGLKRSNFAGMTKLVVLCIDDARLTSIPSDVFVDVEKLEDLSIVKSFLTTLPSNMLLPLKKLRSFDAKHNKLTELSGDLFRGNPSIEYINLIGNNFDGIGVDFTQLNRVSEIYLLKCGCVNSYYVKSSPAYTLKDLSHLIARKCKKEAIN